jgi:hypothetical protein
LALAVLLAISTQGTQRVFGNEFPGDGNYLTPESEPQQVDASEVIKLPCGDYMAVKSRVYFPVVLGDDESRAATEVPVCSAKNLSGN